ncbi:MAG: alpha/beta hydrolase [Clostridia bacterium]|nr:alpha/beta hydrolase [Clostridia bacterium]
MNRAELVFKAIDVFGDRPQNAVHYPGIVRVRDIQYASHNEKMNIGDLYFRRIDLNDGTLHPVLLYIHGGGFIKGDKDYRVTNSEFFAHHGYFVFNIDYRMPPEVSLIENFSDVIEAMNYLQELAKTYNIDLSRIVVSGDSSGAYQTGMLTAVTFDDELRETLGLPEVKLRPAALALMCGLYDLEKLLAGPAIFGLVPETASMILGFKVNRDMSNVTEYEYINYISPTHLVNENWPPVFMTWAVQDLLVAGQGPTLAEELEKFGIAHDTFEVSGLLNNHCYHLMMNTALAKECMNRCVTFLNKAIDYTEKERANEEA